MKEEDEENEGYQRLSHNNYGMNDEEMMMMQGQQEGASGMGGGN